MPPFFCRYRGGEIPIEVREYGARNMRRAVKSPAGLGIKQFEAAVNYAQLRIIELSMEICALDQKGCFTHGYYQVSRRFGPCTRLEAR